MDAKPWFRLYHTVLDDPKVQRLKPVLFKAWVNLLCLASRNEGRLPPSCDIAFALRMDEDTVEQVIADLMIAGLLDEEVGALRPHNWDGRQFQSDTDKTAAERKRRQRQREREAHVTGDVTRDTGRDQGRDVTRDASRSVTRTETETDTDTDPEAEGTTSQGRAEGYRVESTRGSARPQVWDLSTPFSEEAA